MLARFWYDRADVLEHDILRRAPVTEERQELQLFAQIWDGATGEVEWEVSGLVSSKTGEFTVARRVEDVIQTATRDLAYRLPLRQSDLTGTR